VGLLLAGILLHESHEEDEQDGGGGDSDDDGDHHDSPSDFRAHSYVPVAHSHLGDDLVVEAGDEGIEFGIDFAE
jgi:hypothetical protein